MTAEGLRGPADGAAAKEVLRELNAAVQNRERLGRLYSGLTEKGDNGVDVQVLEAIQSVSEELLGQEAALLRKPDVLAEPRLTARGGAVAAGEVDCAEVLAEVRAELSRSAQGVARLQRLCAAVFGDDDELTRAIDHCAALVTGLNENLRLKDGRLHLPPEEELLRRIFEDKDIEPGADTGGSP